MTINTDTVLVITSIFSPTDAVRAFRDRVGDRLIVVGDRKTPAGWTLPPVEFLGAGAQEASGGKLAPLLPWNHYCRKMLGYLRAAQRGAEVIYETDDDNAPKAGWGIPSFEGRFQRTAEGQGFVNVYRAFSDAHIWPRGLPLSSIRDGAEALHEDRCTLVDTSIGVWQSLTDGDPDVDAIYRLVDGGLCYFQDREPLVLGQGTICPFNSQATAFRKSCFPLLYLPAGVPQRVTDILRGLVAQPILWAAGLHLGFTSATVLHERNPHDLMRDFRDELPLYLHTEAMVTTVEGAVRSGASMEDNLVSAYTALERAGFVDADEPRRVGAWLEDLATGGR